MKKAILFTLMFAILFFVGQRRASTQTCPTPPSNSATVTLSVTTTSGTYRVWSRMKAADTSNNSFYLKIDSNCPVLVGDSTNISSTSWTWVDYQNGDQTNKINATLSSGNHVITLIANEPGVSIDKILLTKDLNCVPTDLGTNCPVELPTNTPSPSPIPATATPINSNTPTPTLVPTNSPIPTATPTPVPTQSPVPTATPVPNSTTLHFPHIKLHGIGNGGDNTNANSLGNPTPVTTTKELTVELYDASGKLISTAKGNITFANGEYVGDVVVDSSILTNSYLIKAKTAKYLKKQLPGIVSVTAGQTNQMPDVSLVVGDVNNDGLLSHADYVVLIGCYSDIAPAKDCDPTRKFNSDLSDDGKVDQDDYNLLLRELSVISGD